MFIFSIFYYLSTISITIRKDVSILLSRTALIVIITSLIISVMTMDIIALDKGIGIYGGLFHTNPLTQIFKVFIYIISIIILFLTSFYPRKSKKIPLNKFDYTMYNQICYDKEVSFLNIDLNEIKNSNNFFSLSFIFNKMSEQFRIIEYCFIILLILTGTILLLSTSDLVSLFLSIELQSYGLYLLCSLYKNSELATSAGLTYFLLGGLASCFILLGIGILYSNSANINSDGLYVIVNLSSIIDEYWNDITDWYKPYYIPYSLLILSIGLLFKIAAAPFHIWSPDVYDNVPTIVTTFISIIPKISILICLLELVHYTGTIFLGTNLTWTSGLLLSSLLSLIIGTVLGLTQSRIKRLLAYSTISHLGFILLSISVNSIESSQAFIFYLMQYTISNLNAFILILCMGYALFFFFNDNIEYNKLQDKNNSPIQLTNQIKGYHYINPMLALSLAITLFSFVGVPPLIGFFAKQMVLSSALDKGYVFLVLVAILTSVIAAVYYLGIIKRIYFDQHDYTIHSPNNYNFASYSLYEKDSKYIKSILISNYLSITISIITMLILLFILVPQESLNMSNILTLIIYTSK